ASSRPASVPFGSRNRLANLRSVARFFFLLEWLQLIFDEGMKKQAPVRIVLVGMAALLLPACGTTPATHVESQTNKTETPRGTPAKQHATFSGLPPGAFVGAVLSEENYFEFRSLASPEDQVKLDAQEKGWLAMHPEQKASWDAKKKALLAIHPEWRAQF